MPIDSSPITEIRNTKTKRSANMLSPPNIIDITKIANNFDHPVMPNTVPAELVKVSRAL